MAQALEKVNMSPNLGKMISFAQKMVILFQNSVFGEFQFSQKSLINRKNQPHTLPQQLLVQQTLIYSVVTTSPRAAGRTKCGTASKRRYRKKKLKFWRKGRAATGAHLSKMKAQYQTFQTRYSLFLWYA